MNSNDVFQKSELGLQEIKDQSLGVLPREARTLLILIDGKKTYRRYLDTLDKSKMFVEAGGVAPLLEMLRDLQYIELVGQSTLSSIEQTPSTKWVEPPVVSERPMPLSDTPKTFQSQPTQPTRNNSEAEFAAEFNNAASIQASNKSIQTSANYDTIKSDLAAYIEKNAPAQDAWGYLLSLEQCENDSQLLMLIQKIQNSTSGSLSRGMDKYYKAITN